MNINETRIREGGGGGGEAGGEAMILYTITYNNIQNVNFDYR